MTKKKATPTKKTPSKAEVEVVTRGQQCKARVKKCSECGYKFAAGDRSWHCPECGTFRRCNNKAKFPYTVCRMHGAGGGRPPLTGKFVPPAQIAEAYNAIFDEPGMLSLAMNIALSEARTADLLGMIDDNDVRGQAGDIAFSISRLLNAIYAAENAAQDHNFSLAEFDFMVSTAKNLQEMLNPAVNAEKIWKKVNEQLEITRRLNDTERKWIDQHDQMVPISTALESVSIVIRIALNVITDPKDRTWFAKQMRELTSGIG